jgi:FeS assembly SUF system protein
MEDQASQSAANRQSLPVLPEAAKAAPSTSRQITPLDFGHALHKSRSDFTVEQRALESTIVEVLRTIYDPEIPVNIYELGLIYEIDIDAQNHAKVTMTLTSPGCPVAASLPVEVESRIENIPQITSAEVVLVWDPPWDKTRMSEAAMLDLGML